MKMRIQIIISTFLLLAGTLLAGAREYAVRGPQGVVLIAPGSIIKEACQAVRFS